MALHLRRRALLVFAGGDSRRDLRSPTTRRSTSRSPNLYPIQGDAGRCQTARRGGPDRQLGHLGRVGSSYCLLRPAVSAPAQSFTTSAAVGELTITRSPGTAATGYGPSDTATPRALRFPVGTYTVTLTATGNTVVFRTDERRALHADRHAHDHDHPLSARRREGPLGLPPRYEPTPGRSKRILCPYFRKGGATEMTASGFPTGGRAHPSVSGGSLVRSCREKNLSPCRTAQKVRQSAWAFGSKRVKRESARRRASSSPLGTRRAMDNKWRLRRKIAADAKPYAPQREGPALLGRSWR